MHKKLLKIFLISIFIITIFSSCSKLSSSIPYEIALDTDISGGDIVRLELRVVIPPNTYQQSDLENLIKVIINDYTKSADVNTLTVFLYDRKEDINNFYTIAKADYAPNGDLEQAETVEKGDYKTFDYSFDIKDFTNKTRPTDEQYKIYDEFNEKIFDQSMSEDEALTSLINEFGYTKEQINEAYDSVINYYMQ